MEPVSLPQLQALLVELQAKLDQTSSNSKRFKLGLKIDKCRAMIERQMPTATKKKAPTSIFSPPFSSIAAPLRPTALELARRASRFETDDKCQKERPGANLTLRDARRRAESSSSLSLLSSSSSAATAAAAASSPPAASAAFGRSEALEKPYLRLTSLPTVADVRPPRVLAEALALLKEKWRETTGGSEADGEGVAAARRHYASYFRGQLKSLRQDLVVQSVRGSLAVEAYETHARVALEAGDVAEFNQCQTALEELYREAGEGRGRAGGGAARERERCLRNRAEFASYRILYSQAMAFAASARSSSSSSSSPSSSSSAAITLAMQSVWPADRGHPSVLGALAAAALARAGDAAALAAALEGAPRMSPYLLDLLLPHARAVAARALVAGWRGGTASPLADAARLLGFSSSSAGGGEGGGEDGGERERAAAAAELLRAAGAVVDAAARTVSARRSSAAAAAPVAAAVPVAAAAPFSKKKNRDKKSDRAGDAGDTKEKKKKKR